MSETWTDERFGASPEGRRVGYETRPWTLPALLLFGLLTLSGHGFDGSGAAKRSATLEVNFAGCHAFSRPRLCMLPEDRRLTLWLAPPPGTAVELVAGGPLQPLETVDVLGGRRLRVELPASASELVVRVRGDGSEARWTLPVRPYDEHPRALLGLERAREGRFDEARVLFHEALQGLPFEEQGVLLRRLATLTYDRDRPDRGIQLMRLAVVASRRGGLLSDQASAAGPLAYWLHEQNRTGEARRVLDHLGEIREPGDVAASVAYFRGVLAREAGDLRTALRRFDDVEAYVGKLGDGLYGISRQILAQNLLETYRRAGREEEADRLYAWLRPRADELDAELRRRENVAPEEYATLAALLNNLAWDRLLVLEGGGDVEPPTALLERALGALEAAGRKDEIINVGLNLALAHLHAGEVEAARDRLASARQRGEAMTTSSPVLRLWWLEVEGRLALHDRQPWSALEIYGEMAELALLPEARWSAAVGRARALDDLGLPERAAVAFAGAERLLDDEVLLLPVTAERHRFLGRRELATRVYLELLLRLGREEEALTVARRSRSRVLRTMERDERQAHLAPAKRARWDELIAGYDALRAELERELAREWRLPDDRQRQARVRRAAKRETLARLLDDAYRLLDDRPLGHGAPPPPRSGEVLLLYHPLERGWVGFARDQHGVESHRFPEIAAELATGPRDTAAAGSELLVPFAEQIARAERVRVLPYGPLRAVDFQTLPFGDDVLLVAKPVVYGLDLPAGPREAERGSRSSRALLVVDPTGDLPAAREEARAVRDALRSTGSEVTVLEGREASGVAVREHLARADLVHYAGHGEFGGAGGWDSALSLADGARLTVSDILTLPRVPAGVVLSGCETARVSQRAPAESVASLAYAFLVAGSVGVVASPRPVDDRATARLMTSLYRRWRGGTPLAAALREAQLELRRQGLPAAEWASFRVVEP